MTKPKFTRDGGKFKSGVVYQADRLRILELLDEPPWRCGADRQELANVLGLPRVKTSKHLDGLRTMGKIDIVTERVTGRAGVRSRFFLPHNRDLALAAAAAVNASYKDSRRMHVERKQKEKAKAAREARLAQQRVESIGPITPDRAKVWAMPFQPAGFADLKPGQYLAGDSWASRAFAGSAV